MNIRLLKLFFMLSCCPVRTGLKCKPAVASICCSLQNSFICTMRLVGDVPEHGDVQEHGDVREHGDIWDHGDVQESCRKGQRSCWGQTETSHCTLLYSCDTALHMYLFMPSFVHISLFNILFFDNCIYGS